jgi:cytochrome c
MRAETLVCVLLAFSASACSNPNAKQAFPTGGDVEKGRQAIQRYGCGSCHTIQGVGGATGKIGPPLTGIAERMYLAGELPNTPDNMKKWIEHPHSIHPKTVMPEMGVTDGDARDISAYLYTLH